MALGINKGMAWFIIIVMVASTIGFAMLYASQSQTSNTPSEISDVPISQPSAFRFKAENVPATVYQILPSMRFIASANASDLTTIDAELLSLAGIKNLNSQIRLSDTGEGVDYVAEISYDKELSADDVVTLIESNLPLQIQAAFPYALVEIPKTVTLVPEAEGIDLEQEYTFDDTITSALIESYSEEGDEIELSLSVVLTGTELTYMLGAETNNLTAEIKFHSTELELEVSEFENGIKFTSNSLLPYSDMDFTSLENEISQNENIELVSLKTNLAERSFKLIQEPRVGIATQEFADTLTALEEIESADFSETETGEEVTVNFTPDITYEKAKELVLEKLGELTLPDIESTLTVTVPEMNISGTATLVDPYSENRFSFIEQKLSSLEIEFSFTQNASASIDEITDSELEQTYTYTEPFAVTLKSKHNENDSVPLILTYYTMRSEILDISGKEKLEEGN
ncbi:MAG: hypothetical protein V1672_02990 [Candidatus Diapherotrites archaeon]